MNFIKSLWIRLKRNFKCKHSNIFRYFQWMARANDVIFPSLEEIAYHCKCSIRTVQRAIDRFISYGWLSKRNIAYMSNEYFMPDELKMFDLDSPDLHKNQCFTSSSVQQSVHVLEVTRNSHESVQTVSGHSPVDKEKTEEKAKIMQALPHYLRIPLMAKVDFAKKPGILTWLKSIPEVVALEALNDCRWREKQPGGTTNPVGLLLSRLSQRMKKLKGKQWK